jgi:uncharacterized 2Fe-2S/4Fe-4S cluster protein (DUF4445 family)
VAAVVHVVDAAAKVLLSESSLPVNPKTDIYGPPLIGGHAGSDALADILASRMYQDTRSTVLIDIGTNGEVALGNRDKIMTCSCAAGGACEADKPRRPAIGAHVFTRVHVSGDRSPG